MKLNPQHQCWLWCLTPPIQLSLMTWNPERFQTREVLTHKRFPPDCNYQTRQLYCFWRIQEGFHQSFETPMIFLTLTWNFSLSPNLLMNWILARESSLLAIKMQFSSALSTKSKSRISLKTLSSSTSETIFYCDGAMLVFSFSRVTPMRSVRSISPLFE